MDNYRWTNRMHSPQHDAEVAAQRTTEAMARILDDLRMLDAEELGIQRHIAPVVDLDSVRAG